ncbi:MAG: DUF4214 domain-containing protein [Acidimicrobiales bacterium]
MLTVAGLANGTPSSPFRWPINDAGASPAVVPASNRLIPLELPPFATAEQAAAAALRRRARRTADNHRDRSRRCSASLDQLVAPRGSNDRRRPRLERRLQVVRLYLGFFEREPDPLGVKYWFDEVERGVSLDIVASSFAIASEFERGQTVPDGEFIDAAYERILDRAPDEPGRAYWLAQLGSGLDRGQMLILFSESAEHVAKTRIQANLLAITFGMLERPVTASERSEFGNIVASSGASGLAAHLAGSADYDTRHHPR